jgi:hypothetical protein
MLKDSSITIALILKPLEPTPWEPVSSCVQVFPGALMQMELSIEH